MKEINNSIKQSFVEIGVALKRTFPKEVKRGELRSIATTVTRTWAAGIPSSRVILAPLEQLSNG